MKKYFLESGTGGFMGDEYFWRIKEFANDASAQAFLDITKEKDEERAIEEFREGYVSRFMSIPEAIDNIDILLDSGTQEMLEEEDDWVGP